MKKVSIAPGCVSCGTCQAICPEVFEVTDVCHVKNDVDLVKYEKKIKEAAQACPVGVIGIEGEGERKG
jgi:ferredoxin